MSKLSKSASLDAAPPMNYIERQDPELWASIANEIARQRNGLEMIASENYTSPAVMQAAGSVLTNKYAEGYPGHRYYGGCEFVDVAENLARDRAKKIFGAEHVNVQPHSGAQANMAVYFSTLQPGDVVLGLDLAHGGHLTHGMKLNTSGKLYHFLSYGVRPDDHRIDFDQIAKLARENKPKMIVAGASAYPREIPHGKFAEIAKSCGAKLFVDMAHYAGLVAAKLQRRSDSGGRLRYDDNAQNASRSAWRHYHVQRGVYEGSRSCGISRRARRAAYACHRRQGGLLRRSFDACL